MKGDPSAIRFNYWLTVSEHFGREVRIYLCAEPSCTDDLRMTRENMHDSRIIDIVNTRLSVFKARKPRTLAKAKPATVVRRAIQLGGLD